MTEPDPNDLLLLLLRHALSVCETMIRIADAVGQPFAAAHFSMGLDLLSEVADQIEAAAESDGNGPIPPDQIEDR